MFAKNKNIMIIALLVIIMLLSFFVVGENRKFHNFQNQIAKFDLKEQAYLETIDENGNKLVHQEQIIMSQEQAISSGLLEIEELKKVSSQVSVVTNTIIDTIIVSHVDTVVQEINGNSYLKLPQQYVFADEYLNSKAEINKVGLSIDNITIFNETTITIGKERQGLFRPLKPVVKIKNTNTYMNTLEVRNIVIINLIYSTINVLGELLEYS